MKGRTLGAVTLPQDMTVPAGATPEPVVAPVVEDGRNTALEASPGTATVTTTTTATTNTVRSPKASGRSTESGTSQLTLTSRTWERLTSDYGLTTAWPWLVLLVFLLILMTKMVYRRLRERRIRTKWA